MIYYGMILPIIFMFILLIVGWKIKGDFNLVFDKVLSLIKVYLYFLVIFYIGLEFYSSYGATLNNSKEMIQLSWKYKGELVILLGSISAVEFFNSLGLLFRRNSNKNANY